MHNLYNTNHVAHRHGYWFHEKNVWSKSSFISMQLLFSSLILLSMTYVLPMTPSFPRTLLLSMFLSFTFNCSSFNNSLFYCFIEIIFQNALLNISHWSKITYFTYKFIFSSEGAKLLHSFKSVTRNQISVCFLFNKDYYRIWMTWFFTTWCMWSHLFG